MAYMLLSAVFLSVGALASTQREIQMLSLPITVFQVLMLGFASYGAIAPDSWVAVAGAGLPVQLALGDGGARRQFARGLAAFRGARLAGAVGGDHGDDRRARVPPRRAQVGQPQAAAAGRRNSRSY
ncbi:MAG: hypothetical protein WDN24_09585 [Sphingomonas sp.]